MMVRHWCKKGYILCIEKACVYIEKYVCMKSLCEQLMGYQEMYRKVCQEGLVILGHSDSRMGF